MRNCPTHASNAYMTDESLRACLALDCNLRGRGQGSLAAVARSLGMPSTSVAAVIAGTARAGTVELARARYAEWRAREPDPSEGPARPCDVVPLRPGSAPGSEGGT